MVQRDVVAGTGSIARDLGLPDPEEMDIKAKLAARLSIVVQARGLSPAEAADCAGADKMELDAVLQGQFRDLSVYRLMSFLRALGQDVEIVVRPKVSNVAHLGVVGE